MYNEQKFSKYLSYLLRHNPAEANLHMNEQGFVLVDELIANTGITMEQLETLVKNDKKQRYSIIGNMIRANQGHSIPVKIDFKPYHGNTVYHGTSRSNYEKIMASGAILPMSRQYVHLSKNKETAIKVAKRHCHNDSIVVIVIDGNRLTLYESENGVILADRVPVESFKDVICLKQD